MTFLLPTLRGLCLTLCFLLVGCGGNDNGSLVETPGNGTTAPTGSIVVNQVLLRAVPTTVTQQRFTGFDVQGQVRFGPVSRAKSARVELSGVSTAVTRLQIEYLAGDQVIGLGSVTVVISAGQTTVVNDPPFQDVATALESLQVTPGEATIANGTGERFTAIGTFADGAQLDLSSSVAWSSSDSAVATIEAGGLATSVAPGQTMIGASLGPIGSSASLTVSQAVIASITVTPSNGVIADGTTQPFIATATLTDGTSQTVTGIATWTSEATATATISGSGLATAISPGQTVITASVGSITGTATLTVTNATVTALQVTPAEQTIADGTTLPYTATATFSDGSSQNISSSADWTSSSIATATIAPGGLATAVNPGTTTVSASFGGQTNGTTLTVSAAVIASIAVTPSNPAVADGVSQPFTAMATLTDGSSQNVTVTATWNSGTPARRPSSPAAWPRRSTLAKP